jgi:hypothetical protein
MILQVEFHITERVEYVERIKESGDLARVPTYGQEERKCTEINKSDLRKGTLTGGGGDQVAGLLNPWFTTMVMITNHLHS